MTRLRDYFGDECVFEGDGAPKTTFIKGNCRQIRMASRTGDPKGCILVETNWEQTFPFAVDNCTVITSDGHTNLGSPFNDRYCAITDDGNGGGLCGK